MLKFSCIIEQTGIVKKLIKLHKKKKGKKRRHHFLESVKCIKEAGPREGRGGAETVLTVLLEPTSTPDLTEDGHISLSELRALIILQH